MCRKFVFVILAVFCLIWCWLGPAVGDVEIDIFLLNTEFFFDNKGTAWGGCRSIGACTNRGGV